MATGFLLLVAFFLGLFFLPRPILWMLFGFIAIGGGIYNFHTLPAFRSPRWGTVLILGGTGLLVVSLGWMLGLYDLKATLDDAGQRFGLLIGGMIMLVGGLLWARGGIESYRRTGDWVDLGGVGIGLGFSLLLLSALLTIPIGSVNLSANAIAANLGRILSTIGAILLAGGAISLIFVRREP